MSVRVDGLYVALENVLILDDVNMDIAAGERLAVMGPSGAGKTTLLRTIAGLERPTRGTISVDGRDITDLPPHQRSVGLMFQEFALFPHMTVLENVAYGPRMRGVGREAARSDAQALLDLVGLGAFAHRRPSSLSGGEQQRVALARTLAPKPDIALFDEPLGSLDQELKEGLIAEMRHAVTELGTASIYVTHDRSEAERYGQRLAIMRSGMIIRVGESSEIWSDPRTSFVARFIGHRNVVEGDRFGFAGSTVLVPTSAISISSGGDHEAVVTERLFTQGMWEIEIVVGDVRLGFSSDRDPGPGRTVRVAIAGEMIRPLAVDEVGRPDDLSELGSDVE